MGKKLLVYSLVSKVKKLYFNTFLFKKTPFTDIKKHPAMEHFNNIILFDGPSREDLLPLTFTRPVAALRTGISTLKEKWEFITGMDCSYETAPYLQGKYPRITTSNNLYIDGSIIPDENLWYELQKLNPEEVLLSEEQVIAYISMDPLTQDELLSGDRTGIPYEAECLAIRNTWDIFSLNDQVLRDDFHRLTNKRSSQALSQTNNVLGVENIFVEEGARVEFATLNATTGPIYIGKDVEIMEGALVRGPLALCEHSSLKLGAKIYGATTIGPWCKVGGEVHNSVFTAYSSKAHDGFLGNAVLGEWCNLGADTNNSNLKNNYVHVKLWNYPRNRFVQTGLQFCGLIMGDHSKSAINTMFNTGTVVGVNANIFGAGFPRNFIPSFTWGGPGGIIEYKLDKAFETASVVMERRGLILNNEEKKILEEVYRQTEKYRKRM